ncbi:ABC transporter ATP-binding protein [Agaribacterium haliotis]|uniref:ABC transporter ATP-binding protein n=1 Tax=Agaribacterium haliotis TaxID=2013869 RepID=UPI000BB592AD|nr:ABC transporter ATP-binding protein [Agaribacterium haliotis]
MLDVESLSVKFHTRNGSSTAVEDLSFTIDAGETLGIVGESGSGKSVSCYSMLGLVPCPPGEIQAKSVDFNGKKLLQLNNKELRKIRGGRISMIFQDPMTSLNPFMRIGEQIREAICLHQDIDKNQAKVRAIAALEEVGIKNPEARFRDFPHEFSGGMRQRVMIAMALATEPEILIADEPTTALDVTIQAQILELLKQVQQQRNLAIIFISHDLAVVKDVADKVIVMEKGVVIETGPAQEIFSQPKHDYTKKLLQAIPDPDKALKSNEHNNSDVLLDVAALYKSYQRTEGPFWRKRKVEQEVLKNICFNVYRGEILGLVGESGSGKSTLSNIITGLLDASSGSINYNGRELRFDTLAQRKKVQLVFQDPYASLNPRMTIFDCLAEPLLLHKIVEKPQLQEKVEGLMVEVGLSKEVIWRYPHEFSGGQRQRIAIARALACEPELLIADEPVSALDVTIQAQILRLLAELSERKGLTMLFISHDLSVVHSLCDRVIVMDKGQIVEQGDCDSVFKQPQHRYTQSLINAIPKF